MPLAAAVVVVVFKLSMECKMPKALAQLTFVHQKDLCAYSYDKIFPESQTLIDEVWSLADAASNLCAYSYDKTKVG